MSAGNFAKIYRWNLKGGDVTLFIVIKLAVDSTKRTPTEGMRVFICITINNYYHNAIRYKASVRLKIRANVVHM